MHPAGVLSPAVNQQSFVPGLHLVTNDLVLQSPKSLNILTSRIFPVNIQTIKPQILDQFNCRTRKSLTASDSRGRLRKVGRICPSTDGQQNLELPVLLLEEIQLLDAAINVLPISRLNTPHSFLKTNFTLTQRRSKNLQDSASQCPTMYRSGSWPEVSLR